MNSGQFFWQPSNGRTAGWWCMEKSSAAAKIKAAADKGLRRGSRRRAVPKTRVDTHRKKEPFGGPATTSDTKCSGADPRGERKRQGLAYEMYYARVASWEHSPLLRCPLTWLDSTRRAVASDRPFHQTYCGATNEDSVAPLTQVTHVTITRPEPATGEGNHNIRPFLTRFDNCSNRNLGG